MTANGSPYQLTVADLSAYDYKWAQRDSCQDRRLLHISTTSKILPVLVICLRAPLLTHKRWKVFYGNAQRFDADRYLTNPSTVSLLHLAMCPYALG